MTTQQPRGPLSGIKVLEFAGLGPVPFAAMMLADMGAHVVEIARPGTPPPRANDFLARGRTRVELDLKRPSELTSASEFARTADVLIEGYRPGVMERIGLGPDLLLERNPRLVYGRMTGWGQSGPLASTAGHDINYISISGALHCMRGTDGAPVPPLNLAGDLGGGSLYLVAGVLAALLERHRTGKGQVIDAAICDSVAHMLTPFYMLKAQGMWQDRAGINVLDGGAHFYRTYRCADGGYLSIGALEPEFHALMWERLGLPAEAASQAEADWPRLSRLIEAQVATRTRDEWAAIFEGTDGCVAPVLDLSEAAAHPHMRARQTTRAVDGATCSAAAPRFSEHEHARSFAPPARVVSAEDGLAMWSALHD